MLTATANRHLSTFIHLRNKQKVCGILVPSVRQFIFKHPNPQAAVNLGTYEGRLGKEMMSILDGGKTSSQPFVWTTTLFMAALHIGAIAALFCAWRNLLASGRRDHDPDVCAFIYNTLVVPFVSSQQTTILAVFLLEVLTIDTVFVVIPVVVVLVVTVVDPDALFFARLAAIPRFAPLLHL